MLYDHGMAKLPPRATNANGTLSARIKPRKARADKEAPHVTKVIPYPKEASKIWQFKNSPGGKFLVAETRKVVAGDKAAAPRSTSGSHGRSSGYLAQRIGMFIGQDESSVYTDVVSRAKTKRTKKGPNKGKTYYYGRIVNQKKHYMEKGLRNVGG